MLINVLHKKTARIEYLKKVNTDLLFKINKKIDILLSRRSIGGGGSGSGGSGGS